MFPIPFRRIIYAGAQAIVSDKAVKGRVEVHATVSAATIGRFRTLNGKIEGAVISDLLCENKLPM